MRIVRDEALQNELEENGFITFPCLNTDTVRQLSLLFDSVKEAHVFNGKYHHSTFHTGDIALSKKVSDAITHCIQTAITDLFIDYEVFVANFMIKEPGEVSEVCPHQDWTYVDENKFQSLNLWIPLQDVNEDNGCLTMLKGSHSLFYSHRPSPQYPGIFDPVMDKVRNHMESVPMKSGEGILFYHSLLHGSLPNLTNQRRVNIVVGLHNKGAQLQHLVFKPSEEKIYEYVILPEEFSKIMLPGFLESKTPEAIMQPVFPQITQPSFLAHFPNLSDSND